MAADPLIGKDLGKYRIESRIGAGGMGVVYLAQHAVIEDRRALKVLSSVLAGQEDYRERFLKEARLPAGLNHPSILPIFDAGDEDGVLYLVMPYVRGADLQVLIDEGGPLDVDEAVTILGAVADALDEAHASKLIHRDVKPSNVLVGELETKGRHVYLSDFGLVKAVDDAARASGTTQGMVVGTPPYIAPELWREEPIDGSLDQYALSCTMFHALTGVPPYQATTMYAWMHAHTAGPIPSASALRSELPSDVDEPLARGLAKDPADRFESCTALVDAVASSVGSLPPAPTDTLEHRLRPQTMLGIETVARQRSAGGRKPPPPKWWKYALVAAGVVVVSVLAWLVLRPEDGALEPAGQLPGRPLVAARDDANGSAIVAVQRAAGGATVFRIQPGSLKQTRVAVVDDTPVQIVVDGRTSWILTSESGIGTLVRVLEDGSEPHVVNLGGTPGEMTQTGELMWVTVPFRDEVKVIDKDDLTSQTIENVKGARLITPAAGAVIVVGEEGGTSINVSTGAIDGPESITGTPTDIATAGGDAWIASKEGPVARIDIVDGEVVGAEEAIDIGGEPQRIAPGTNPPAVWLPLRSEGRIVIARIGTVSLEEQIVPLPDPAGLISTGGDPVVVVTTEGDVLRIAAGTGEIVGEREQVEGTLGPMVPLGNQVLLLAADGSMYLLPR